MSRTIYAIALLALGLGAAACADDPCSDLSDSCSSCTDALIQESCEATVRLDNGDACQNALDDPNFSTLCPGE